MEGCLYSEKAPCPVQPYAAPCSPMQPRACKQVLPAIQQASIRIDLFWLHSSPSGFWVKCCGYCWVSGPLVQFQWWEDKWISQGWLFERMTCRSAYWITVSLPLSNVGLLLCSTESYSVCYTPCIYVYSSVPFSDVFLRVWDWLWQETLLLPGRA